MRNPLTWHLDKGSGLGVAAGPRLPRVSSEGSEAAKLDLIVGPQRPHDAVENRFHDYLGFVPRHLQRLADSFNQIGFLHKFPVAA
jgi:hypothetical protein